MVQRLDYLKETPSQTAGPFVHIGLSPRRAGFEMYDAEPGEVIAGPNVPGERIAVEGTVFDGIGDPVRDALIEVWQADAAGTYGPREDFAGWGRVVPDFETGRFVIETVKPGRTTMPDGATQAPHLSLWLVARGINVGLQTRLYFGDEDNAGDPLLSRVPRPRRSTLIARPTAEGRYAFDIRLQGDGETVFLDI